MHFISITNKSIGSSKRNDRRCTRVSRKGGHCFGGSIFRCTLSYERKVVGI